MGFKQHISRTWQMIEQQVNDVPFRPDNEAPGLSFIDNEKPRAKPLGLALGFVRFGSSVNRPAAKGNRLLRSLVRPDHFFHPDHVIPGVKLIAAVMKGAHQSIAHPFVKTETVKI